MPTLPIELRLGGYFPRHVVATPEWLNCPAVVDVCSVSRCVSPGPKDWVHLWLHNGLALFNQPEQARLAVTPDDPAMTVFAYRISTVRFVAGEPEPWAWPEDAVPVPLPDGFVSLGYDAVQKSADDILGFECSPLSCNSVAPEWPVNRHCLLDDFDTAVDAARQFSIDQPEPGMYYVAEVFAPPV
ncbi:MAG: hypothetical protein ABIT71_09745 [Vicinamibacteraceae bacterium]